jgi:predicted nuclease of predicted toxin-antitoxin system
VLGLLRREPTIDFQTASQGDVIGRPDREVLAIAARENRILISHDHGTMPAHFKRFTATQSSPGLILVSQEIHLNCTDHGYRILEELQDIEDVML